MKILKQIINLPALILHEISHVVVAFILGGKLKSVKIKEHSKGHLVCLLNITGLKENYVKYVAFSPLLIPLIFLFSGIAFPTIGIVYLIYSLITLKTTLPSPTDFKTCGLNPPKFLSI